jgi:hypothetical protein
VLLLALLQTRFFRAVLRVVYQCDAAAEHRVAGWVARCRAAKVYDEDYAG